MDRLYTNSGVLVLIITQQDNISQIAKQNEYNQQWNKLYRHMYQSLTEGQKVQSLLKWSGAWRALARYAAVESRQPAREA